MRDNRVCMTLALGCLWLIGGFLAAQKPDADDAPSTMKSKANELRRQQPGFFVPNLGQWAHRARFVHRSGPLTVFLEDRGWVIDLVERPAAPGAGPHAMPTDREVDRKVAAVALKMTFEGEAHLPEIVGEKRLAGHHNYFFGNDESRWRTGVPLYASVRYANLYPGIDLRLRESNGAPEYDLLLQPGADLTRVSVHVEGARRLSIARNGSLVIDTALGPVTQSVPKTWEVGADGTKRDVVCKFTLLGTTRFGFEAMGWGGDTNLTIDPGLVWSTFLGGAAADNTGKVWVDASGVVTMAGDTFSIDIPTTLGAYNRTYNGNRDFFVSRLDPSLMGTAQLVFSTFLGGNDYDHGNALFVDRNGVMTLAGGTKSANFPTTPNAYDRTYNGAHPQAWYGDVFITRLDPRRTGTAQLVYSTFLGGSGREGEGVGVGGLSVDSTGVATVVGRTGSTDFPTTPSAYDRTFNGGYYDVFVSRLDPSLTGAAQLVYSTFLGGNLQEEYISLSVDQNGVATLVGNTTSSDFPTTPTAYSRTLNGSSGWQDLFVSRLDPSRTGTTQLVYSTYLGGSGWDSPSGHSVDQNGVVTIAGHVAPSFPTTPGAYDTTHNGSFDACVARLDPNRTGTAQLVYSTFLGGSQSDWSGGLSVDRSGVVTVTGSTDSPNFPTTPGAYDRTHNGSDAFVARLDPSRTGTAQLVYSTFLGGSSGDGAGKHFVDPNGVVTVVGQTGSTDFPTTSGAFDRTYNGSGDTFVTRLAITTLDGTGPLKPGSAVTLTLGAPGDASLPYQLGSSLGTGPIRIGIRQIGLSPDDLLMVSVNGWWAPIFSGYQGVIDSQGQATAAIRIPNFPLLVGKTIHTAFVTASASAPLGVKSISNTYSFTVVP